MIFFFTYFSLNNVSPHDEQSDYFIPIGSDCRTQELWFKYMHYVIFDISEAVHYQSP